MRDAFLHVIARIAGGGLIAPSAAPSRAQMPPSPAQIAGYTGLFAAAARGDAAQITVLVAAGAKPDMPSPAGLHDGAGEEPLGQE